MPESIHIDLERVMSSVDSPSLPLCHDRMTMYDRIEADARREEKERKLIGERCRLMNPLAWRFDGGDDV